MNIFKSIIIDAKSENISALKSLLNLHCPDILVAGEASNVEDGIDLFNRCQPQIIFVEVELEGKCSLNILDKVKGFDAQIIVVAKNDDYALKAIEYDVVDYVLKPVFKNDLLRATSRAIAKIKQNTRIVNTVTNVKFVAIASIEKIELIDVKNIVYCQAKGRYTCFYLENGDLKLSTRNLGEYDKLLSNNTFFRIHHQYLVNFKKVVSINKAAGNYCELTNKVALPIAKRRLTELSKYLRIK